MHIGDILKYNEQFAHINSIISSTEDHIQSQTGCKVKLTPNLITEEYLTGDKVDVLIGEILACWNVNKEIVTNSGRTRECVVMRNIIYKAIRFLYPTYSLNNIGKKFNRHHATIINGIETINNMLKINDELSIEYFTPVKHFFR